MSARRAAQPSDPHPHPHHPTVPSLRATIIEGGFS